MAWQRPSKGSNLPKNSREQSAFQKRTAQTFRTLWKICGHRKGKISSKYTIFCPEIRRNINIYKGGFFL